eukprot:2588908-Rhodomonas_salina.1
MLGTLVAWARVNTSGLSNSRTWQHHVWVTQQSDLAASCPGYPTIGPSIIGGPVWVIQRRVRPLAAAFCAEARYHTRGRSSGRSMHAMPEIHTYTHTSIYTHTHIA